MVMGHKVFHDGILHTDRDSTARHQHGEFERQRNGGGWKARAKHRELLEAKIAMAHPAPQARNPTEGPPKGGLPRTPFFFGRVVADKGYHEPVGKDEDHNLPQGFVEEDDKQEECDGNI